MTPDLLISVLAEARVMAILRGDDPARLVASAGVLAKAGVDVLEVSLTSENALDVITDIRTTHPGLVLGAGTVLSAAQAKDAVAAGAGFLVSPTVAAGAIAAADALGIGILVGALTPTEVDTAWLAGATAVKVFPASAMGGPDYLAALRGPFPDIPLVAVGGVGLADVPAYLAAGALAVGIGSPLLGRDLDGLADRAALAVSGAH
ncbi:bifunctional 4-hydroxy-2-oxoglutarate aldolase/2-dehydro-3-deoxy-phosphogluconate aldolase [Actinokineospora sp. HUAS TT18]|uniref:bifunctional 4-hydroxy-2-oxoglutarate aldolase/2-dehydro-3-deoxy-phosphogluconate aldolase n=1 Tax=Actinokineospora sp. HUAS TT18 TaxID=3447451 RepID=UPI003F525432